MPNIVLDKKAEYQLEKACKIIAKEAIARRLSEDFNEDDIVIIDSINGARNLLGEKVVEVSVNNKYVYFSNDNKLVEIFWRH